MKVKCEAGGVPEESDTLSSRSPPSHRSTSEKAGPRKPTTPGPRKSKLVASAAILEASRSLSKEGDNLSFIRVLKPSMEPREINTKSNIASIVFGERRGHYILDRLVYRNPMFSLFLLSLFWTGLALGLLSLFSVIEPHYAILGSLLTLPGLIVNGYLHFITGMIGMLLTKFETW
jgi:hypothetical protein